MNFIPAVDYTLFDESGTVTMGRYQDPRPPMGHLISNFYPDGTLSCYFWGRRVVLHGSGQLGIPEE